MARTTLLAARSRTAALSGSRGTEPAGGAPGSGQFVAVTDAPPAALTEIVPNIGEIYQSSLADIATQLNGRYELPTQLTLKTANCGVPNALYNPQTHEAMVCWELLQLLVQQMQTNGAFATPEQANEAMQNVYGVWIFFLFHEVGHAFIHLHQLPSTGREEDAVDQLSTLMLLGGGPDGVRHVASASITMAAFEQILSPTPAWDEHAMGPQRMTNLLCWTYGMSPSQSADVVDMEIPGVGPLLPSSRAARCEGEYQNMSRAWATLLGPHTK